MIDALGLSARHHVDVVTLWPGWVIVIGLVVCAAGVGMWIHSENVASTFASLARPIFGEKLTNGVHTSYNAKWGAGGFAVFGLVFLVFGIIGTVNYYAR